MNHGKDDSSAIEDELNSFKLVATYFKTASGAVTALAAVLPLGGLLDSSLVPVQPELPGLACGMSVIAMAVAVFGFRTAPPEELLKWGRRGTIAGVVVLLVYLCLNWSFIFENDGARVVTGHFVTQESIDRVQRFHQSGQAGPGDPPTADSLAAIDLLDSFGYNHARQAWSDVTVIAVIINLTFCCGCVMLSLGFFCFVLRNAALDQVTAAAHTATESTEKTPGPLEPVTTAQTPPTISIAASEVSQKGDDEDSSRVERWSGP